MGHYAWGQGCGEEGHILSPLQHQPWASQILSEAYSHGSIPMLGEL